MVDEQSYIGFHYRTTCIPPHFDRAYEGAKTYANWPEHIFRYNQIMPHSQQSFYLTIACAFGMCSRGVAPRRKKASLWHVNSKDHQRFSTVSHNIEGENKIQPHPIKMIPWSTSTSAVCGLMIDTIFSVIQKTEFISILSVQHHWESHYLVRPIILQEREVYSKFASTARDQLPYTVRLSHVQPPSNDDNTW